MTALLTTYEANSLATLDLSQRALNHFTAMGITTIGQLMNGGRNRLAKLHTGSKKTVSEVDQALGALALSITRGGEVDWVSYASKRGFLVLPRVTKAVWSAREFLEALPLVTEEIASHRYGARGLTVLKGRLLRNRGDYTSLEIVGKRLGLTKQAVRLIEAQLIDMFRRTMLYEEYCGYKFRFRPEYVQAVRKMASICDLLSKRFYSRAQWLLLAAEVWGVGEEQLANTEHLLLGIVDSELKVIKRTKEQAAFLSSPTSAQSLRILLREIKRRLTYQSAAGLRPEELQRGLQTKLGAHACTVRELPEAISILLKAEFDTVSARYRIRTTCLSGSNLYERILLEAGKPLHFREIWQTAYRELGAGAILLRSLSSELIADHRFVALSRSGFWALAEWPDVETRSVEDICAELLSNAGVAMTEQALFEVIAGRRPLKKRSIGTQLGRDVRFERAAPKTWKLAAQQAPELEQSA